MSKEKLLRDIERTLYCGSSVQRTPMEKLGAGLIKLFVPEYDTDGIPAFKCFRDAYVRFTGDTSVSGLFRPDSAPQELRASCDFSSSSFANALENALNRYLSKTYKAFPYHEEILISDKKSVSDFRKIHSVQLGYFGDLPDIDPETGDYESLEQYGDTESEYELSQKGAIIWVTRKHIVNDDVDGVKAMVKRMARSARMTHARYVWSFYINNSTCPDGTAWFTLAHGNLSTDALHFDPLVTGVTALANMTEPGPSGEKLGMDLGTFAWHLVVPISLWDAAVKRNQAQVVDVNNTPNALHHLFGERNERVVVCPFITDTNNWGIIRDKEDVPIIEMSYMHGKEDPEFIIENGPTREHVMRADKLGYKIRHEYGGTLSDIRGGYKSEVS